MSEAKKEWKLPKNIRQIGDGEEAKKVYIEDYVVTFLCRPEPEAIERAILLGEIHETENSTYIFVNGALKTETFSVDEAAKADLCRQMDKYFPQSRIVGWYMSLEEPEEQSEELIQKETLGEYQVLLARDMLENEIAVFAKDGEVSRQLQGYYIYYDKNQPMQDYLIEENHREPVEKEKEIRDDAIRRFRRIIRDKKTEKNKKAGRYVSGRFAYAAGGFLLTTVMALGVTMIYNYDKMRAVEHSLVQLSGNMESQIEYVTDESGNTAEVMLHIDEELPEETEVVKQEAAQTEEFEAVAKMEEDNITQTQSTEKAQEQSEVTETEEQASEQERNNTVARASYTVKMGDTLAGISEMYYGSLDRVAEICALNGIADENTILPGQKILLP